MRTIAQAGFFVSNGTGAAGIRPNDQPASKYLEDSRQVEGGRDKGNRMKTKDNRRKWMWWFLTVVVALQLYFVQELLAAFAMFALGFLAIAFVVASVYMLHKGWEFAVERVGASGNPVVTIARRGVSAVEDMTRRPLRRPGSEPAR